MISRYFFSMFGRRRLPTCPDCGGRLRLTSEAMACSVCSWSDMGLELLRPVLEVQTPDDRELLAPAGPSKPSATAR
jgi:hypothetical protein